MHDARFPLISVVTPTLNRAPLLRDTIESIRRQVYPNLEHIIIDGGSTDGTLDLLTSAEGSYPISWVSEPDTGMYNAVNKGLARARGEIVAYLNSDDLYFPWTLATVAKAFTTHEDADFVFGDILSVDDETGAQTPLIMTPFDLGHLRRVGFLGQPAVFWRRRVVEAEGGFDESLRFVADCDYWMRTGAQYRYRKINEFLAIQREHAGTLRSTDPRVWTELATVRERYAHDAGSTTAFGRRVEAASHRLRFRAIWSAFLMQALLPQRLRLRQWSRLLNHGRVAVSRKACARLAIPVVARGAEAPVFLADRYWLDQANTAASDRPLE
jgi:glycosyl transferase family 2